MELKNLEGTVLLCLGRARQALVCAHEPAAPCHSQPRGRLFSILEAGFVLSMNIREGMEDCSCTQGCFRMKFRADYLGERGSRVETSIIRALWLGCCLVLLCEYVEEIMLILQDTIQHPRLLSGARW